jgi:hypothetical protein
MERNKKPEKKSKGFFEVKPLWEKEWEGMPEFTQNDLTSFRKIIVHFRNQEDVEEFAKLLNQRITKKQPSIWYPKREIRHHFNKRYIDES